MTAGMEDRTNSTYFEFDDASNYESSDDTLDVHSVDGSEKPDKGTDSDDESLESINHDDEFMASVEMKWKAKKALLEFRCKVEDAILGNYILGKNALGVDDDDEVIDEVRDICLWDIPLLPSKSHVGTDIILLKFLKAKDFKVSEAFDMLQNTLKWRKEYKVDEIVHEKLSSQPDGFDHFTTTDKEGRPLCFFSYTGFKNRELKKKNLGKEENREEFLRWRVQIMERAIKRLSFKPGCVDSVIEITDLKSLSGPATKEVRSLNKRAIIMLQDYYPELIGRHIVLNAPFWYFTSHKLLSGFMSQRTKRKFVMKRSSSVRKTLLKYVAAQDLPAQYGGLKRENNEDFLPEDKVSELTLKGNTVATLSIPAKEVGVTMMWELTVAGIEVSYKEEFVPDDEGSYTILLKTQKRMEDSVKNSYYINEPGSITITIDNGAFKKIKVHYRYKSKPTVPLYINCLR